MNKIVVISNKFLKIKNAKNKIVKFRKIKF